MPKARANIYAYSSTLFSGLIFEEEMICIPRTARYVVRNQAETAEDAESMSEHQRIQQYSLFTRKKNARERKKADVRISHQTENQKENVGIRIYPLWL